MAPAELRFNNSVDGEGSFAGNVVFANQFSPGNSPAEVIFADQATLLTTATLEIELGGLIAKKVLKISLYLWFQLAIFHFLPS